jgi:hypothetical protein
MWGRDYGDGCLREKWTEVELFATFGGVLAINRPMKKQAAKKKLK